MADVPGLRNPVSPIAVEETMSFGFQQLRRVLEENPPPEEGSAVAESGMDLRIIIHHCYPLYQDLLGPPRLQRLSTSSSGACISCSFAPEPSSRLAE